MPRKNKSPQHTPYTFSTTARKKRRYTTRKQAEKIAEEQMLLTPGLEIHVYQDIDGGWYLTRTKNTQP